MAIGKVKWFDAKKGFGFIVCPEAEAEVFVHHTQIDVPGYRRLDDGQDVEFDIIEGPKGLSAENVIPV